MPTNEIETDLQIKSHWTMNRGQESLKLELLRRRAGSEEELARIPAAPRPSLVVRLLGLGK